MLWIVIETHRQSCPAVNKKCNHFGLQNEFAKVFLEKVWSKLKLQQSNRVINIKTNYHTERYSIWVEWITWRSNYCKKPNSLNNYKQEFQPRSWNKNRVWCIMVGTGAALEQHTTEGWQTVAIWSAIFQFNWRTYSINELEFLGLVWSTEILSIQKITPSNHKS